MASPVEPLVYSFADACRALRVSKDTLRQWTRRAAHPIPTIRVGSRYRYPVDQLKIWLAEESSRTDSTSDSGLYAVAASTTLRAGTRTHR